MDDAAATAARVPRWLVAVLALAGVTIAFFANLRRVQDFDPQYIRVIVERVQAFGGTFYENGIHNKGPLEPFVYWLARQVGSYDGFWYVISLLVALAAGVIAWAAWATARVVGTRDDLAIAVAIVVFIHFSLFGADYAGVLYARNMTTTLLAVVWIGMLADPVWSTARRRLTAVIVAGAVLGLAVQTLLTTAFTAAAVAATLLVMLSTRASRREVRRLGAGLLGAAALVVVSAPLWYAARGSFTPFWSGWWTHARYMNAGTGRSLGGQIGLAWDELYAYYQQRPLGLGIVVAAVIVTIRCWARWDVRFRAIHAGLLGWLAAAWLELLVSQRYSSHYFSVTSVPTALLAATVVGFVAQRLLRARPRKRELVAVPLAVAVGAVYLSGPQYVDNGVRSLLAFESPSERADKIERSYVGNERSVYAVLDAVSQDGDPLLAWTNEPWPYLRWNRVSATRFIWKSFLMGEIYLGRTSEEYVLDDSWEWFDEDLAESEPRVFVEVNTELASETPFGAVVADQFRVVYPGAHPVYYRNELADEILDVRAEQPWAPPEAPEPSSGWRREGTTLHYADGPDIARDAGVDVLNQSCTRLDGVIDTDGEGFGTVVFRFDDPTGASERVRLAFEGDRVVSGNDYSAFEEIPSELTEPGPVPFSLVVGPRSALLIVNDAIRAAVRLPGPVVTSAEPHSASLVLRDLRVDDTPMVTGCS